MSKMKNLFKFKKSTSDLTEWNKTDEKLLQAVQNGDTHKVEALLSKKNTSATKQDLQGRTVLHYAATHGKDDSLEILLSHGAEINAADFQGKTSLHCAARHGWAGLIQKLLQANAGLEYIDEAGMTALHHACLGGHLHCVQVLIKAGAKLNAANKDGRTPLFLSAQMGSASICMELINHGANLNAQDNELRTPLMLAAEHGSKDICEMFIKKGALAQMTDRLGRSAGWYALDNGHSNIKYIVDNAPAAASWDVGADEVTVKQPEHVDFVDAFISSQNRLEGGDSTEDEGGHDNESDEDNTMLNQLNKDTKNTKHSSVSKNIPEPINSGQQRASTQMTMDLYRELEEEHDLLNQEYNQLTVKYNKLVQKQQQKEGQGQQQNAIDATLIESLEEEVQRLTSQLTQAKDREQEYVEEIQGLKDQLSAFQASDVEKEGSDVDSWGDTDDELFDLPGTDKRQPGTITQKLPKSTLSSEDQQNKKQIAVLRSQLLELTRDNDALKEKMSKMKPMSDSSEPVSLSKSEDERETVPLSQYEDLKRANESEVRDLKHKIAELESEKLTFITAIETTVPEEKYEEMQTSSELQIADMQGIISGLEKELERVNGQMSSNQQSSKTLEEHLQQKSLEVMTLQNEIVNLEAKISQLKQTGSPREGKQLEDTYGMEIAKLKQFISESEIKIQTLEQARENTIPNDLYKEMKKKNNEEKQVLQSQIDTLQEQLESVAKELNELTVHTDKLMSEKEGLAGKNKTLTQEVEKLQLQLENLQQYHEKTHTERETRLKQAGELTCELGRIQDTISHMSTENTQLKDTVQQQVKEIVELKDQLEKKVWYERQLMDQLAALKKENSHLKELELEKENFVAEMTNLKHHVAELEKENSQVRELIDENEKLFSENARLKQQKKTENKKDSQLTVDVKTKIEKLTYDNAQLKQQVTASNKESSKLKRDICSLNETVEKLNKALSRHQEQRSPSQSASGDGKQLQAMQNQIEKLKQQLAEADVKHREVVNTYRTHLLSAVQGRMDPDVQEALHHIISLRSKEQFC